MFLRVSGKNRKEPPTVHRVLERFRNFKRLHDDLHTLSKELLITAAASKLATQSNNYMNMVKTPFPTMSINSYVGLSLSSRAVTERCAILKHIIITIITIFYQSPLPSSLIIIIIILILINHHHILQCH